MKYCMAILLALASFNTYAGLTKWVDSNGVVHYSDSPPPQNVQSQTVRVQSSDQTGSSDATPASGPAAPKTIFEMESDLKKEQKAKAEADKKAAQKRQEEETKQRNCQQARNQLDTLRNAPRIATYDDQGNRTIMDDSARERSIGDAQAAVSQYCN